MVTARIYNIISCCVYMLFRQANRVGASCVLNLLTACFSVNRRCKVSWSNTVSPANLSPPVSVFYNESRQYVSSLHWSFLPIKIYNMTLDYESDHTANQFIVVQLVFLSPLSHVVLQSRQSEMDAQILSGVQNTPLGRKSH